MVSGAQQGRLLHTLVRLARARRVLEVGSFTGYATLWMALALPESGRLVSLERDARVAEVARWHLDAAGVGSRVELCVGDALDALAADDVLQSDSCRDVELVIWHCGQEQTAPDGDLP